MRPYDCKTTKQVCLQRTDNADSGDFWITSDGYGVCLAEQKLGTAPKQIFRIPRANFNRLVSWYMREQKR